MSATLRELAPVTDPPARPFWVDVELVQTGTKRLVRFESAESRAAWIAGMGCFVRLLGEGEDDV